MTVLVLVGGRGSRLGGPKHSAPLCGKPLLRWVLDSVPSDLGEVIVVSPVRPGGLDYADWIWDPGKGPAVALRTAAEHLEGRALLVGGDMPFLEPDALRLVDKIPSEATVPLWSNGFMEPLHAAYDMGAVLRTTSMSLHGLVWELNPVLVSAEYMIWRFGPHIFFNVNTEEDLARATRILRSLRSRECS